LGPFSEQKSFNPSKNGATASAACQFYAGRVTVSYSAPHAPAVRQRHIQHHS